MNYTPQSHSQALIKIRCYVAAIVLLASCSDDEIKIDNSQLTLGIWQYEYKDNPVKKNTTIIFSADGTYAREDVYFSLSGTTSSMKEGAWAFVDGNILDLTGFGTCVQPVGGPPCTPPDVDFKIFRLTSKVLEVEEWVNGNPPFLPGKTEYINIKP
ncbi:MAG TPA: hypothetical protein PLV21_17035 [Cyclobacteriaceae bacterium]|nr:hypothetical protein [Cyclobacteriaceae bacterium]HRJ83592.1 hypothetical protein [Cyclobacteriaceae bacterium]